MSKLTAYFRRINQVSKLLVIGIKAFLIKVKFYTNVVDWTSQCTNIFINQQHKRNKEAFQLSSVFWEWLPMQQFCYLCMP